MDYLIANLFTSKKNKIIYNMSKICKCSGCHESKNVPILQRLNDGCECFLCERKENFPYMYYSCIELHFHYVLNFQESNEIVKQNIRDTINNYKRKKKIVIYYFYYTKKLLDLYTEIQYRPGGSGYIKSMENFYRIARLREKN